MTTPLWRYPGLLNGRIQSSNSLLVSALESYYYGQTGIYNLYDPIEYDYDYYYYEGYGYYSGHIWCAGDDSLVLPDFRFLVGDYASVQQDDINDLHTIDYVQFLLELRTRIDHPKDARRLTTVQTCVFVNDGALAAGDGLPCIILPTDAIDLFEPSDYDRLVEVSAGGTNSGVYRIAGVPWDQGKVNSSPGTGEYLNGRVAILDVGVGGSLNAESAAVTVEMLGLRWVGRAYYDATEKVYVEESPRHSWARTLHVHCSKASLALLRTLKYEVNLEAVNSSFAQVAAAAGMPCRVPAPALYIDELYRIESPEHIAVLNAMPQDDETDVPIDEPIRLHIVSFDNQALNATAKVWVTRSTDQLRVLAYDQAAGGFQPGYSGIRSSATVQASPDSGVNDELLLVIHQETDFTSLETILVEVEATNTGGESLGVSYAFTIEDLTAPVLEEILWLTPRKCRLKFDEPVSTAATPGGSLMMAPAVSGVAVLSGNRIALPGTTMNSAWAGYWVSVANSYPENAGPWEILSVETGGSANPGNQILTVDGVLIEDDGVDANAAGTVIQRRDIIASVSPYYLEARLADEGGGSNDGPDAAIQVAFCPVPIEAALPETEELQTGEDQRQYVYLTFHDDISIGRKYRLHATGIDDIFSNRCGDVTLDFVSPLFGSPTNRLTMWSDGIVAASDRKRDLESDGHLRKLAVVLQDLLNVLWYRVDSVQYLDDPMRCHPDWVDHLLYERGNPFRFPIDSEMLRRRLANALPGFYKKVGVVPGIVDMLKLLLGIEFTIQVYNSADYWRLGFSHLGSETTLGPGTAWARNSYEIDSPIDLTDEQRRIVIAVATWADPADLHLVRIVEPSTSTPVVPTYWTLGYSALGFTTTLGA